MPSLKSHIAFFDQAAVEKIGHLRGVFNHQQSHRHAPPAE
jgi:hypothetical protein